MNPPSPFDFWYAVQNTEVLQRPRRVLETFGATRIRYHLITEPMDSVEQVRVREGTLEAAKPQILTPLHMKQTDMQGFEDEEAGKFLAWLRETQPQLRFLQYGFTISKQDVRDTLLNESLQVVEDNVLAEVRARDDAFTAVLRGVDQPWEVCLLKLMVDLVESSREQHVADLRERNLLPNPNRDEMEIEQDFAMAARDVRRIPYLHKQLLRKGVFERYQDRFFALVRESER